MKIRLIDYGVEPEMRPVRAHDQDAGLDVFSPRTLYIPDGDTASIGLGFGIDLPAGFMGLIYARSSMIRNGLACEHSPIDAGYTGEIHAIITNQSGGATRIERGQRIGQLVIMPIVYAELVDEIDDTRGTGAFGSTGA